MRIVCKGFIRWASIILTLLWLYWGWNWNVTIGNLFLTFNRFLILLLDGTTSWRKFCIISFILLSLLWFFTIAVSAFWHFYFFLWLIPSKFLNSFLPFLFHFLNLLLFDFLDILGINWFIVFYLKSIIFG